MPGFRRMILLTLLAVCPVFAVAEENDRPPEIRPGDPAVDGSFIEPYENAWQLRRETDGHVTEVGRWTDQVTIETVEGEEVLTRRQFHP